MLDHTTLTVPNVCLDIVEEGTFFDPHWVLIFLLHTKVEAEAIAVAQIGKRCADLADRHSIKPANLYTRPLLMREPRSYFALRARIANLPQSVGDAEWRLKWEPSQYHFDHLDFRADVSLRISLHAFYGSIAPLEERTHFVRGEVLRFTPPS